MVKIDKTQFIVEFDASAPAAVEIQPDQEVIAEVMDWCFGEVNENPETCQRACQQPRCPAAGPISVRGAQPGDALAVEILEIIPKSPGFMVIRPGCGPVGAQVQKIQVIRIPLERGYALLPSGLKIPVEPMLGVIGTTPAEEKFLTLEAGDHGGNLDTKEVCQASVVFLPVQVPGGLLAFGDVHAVMGDGELSGSGVEVNATVRIRVNLRRNANLTSPRIETPQKIITLATRGQVEQAVELVTKDMVSWLKERYGLGFRDALLLIGAAGSLRFSQVINKPGPTVKLVLEKPNTDRLTSRVWKRFQ